MGFIDTLKNCINFKEKKIRGVHIYIYIYKKNVVEYG